MQVEGSPTKPIVEKSDLQERASPEEIKELNHYLLVSGQLVSRFDGEAKSPIPETNV